jgi:ssDNA-binding Zn-finger/Zn-ribbon topoisomerase 1
MLPSLGLQKCKVFILIWYLYLAQTNIIRSFCFLVSTCSYTKQFLFVECKDIGDMNVQCPKCGAMVWNRETIGKSSDLNAPEVSICCMKGNIVLPYIIQPPTLIRNLFSGLDSRSANFISNLRCYNNMFAFISFGGRVESRGNDGRVPPNFIIAGQNYHRIGSLMPSEGDRPKFAQLYKYDTENEVQNRFSHFRCVFNFLC